MRFDLLCKLWESALHLTGGVAGPSHNGLHTLFQLADIVRIRERGPSGEKEERRGGGEGKTDSTPLATTDKQ